MSDSPEEDGEEADRLPPLHAAGAGSQGEIIVRGDSPRPKQGRGNGVVRKT